MITRSNVRKELSDVASCDHIDLAECWSCGTISNANLETINSNVTGLMGVRVRRLLLAADESDTTVELGHVFPLLRQRPTPLSLVRKTSWSPTLPCGRWPPLRPRFCTTAQIRGFLSTPVARYERTLQVSWRAQAAPPTDFFHGSAQHAAWTIQRGDPGVANVAPRVHFQAALLSIEGGGGKGCVAYLCVLLPGLALPAHIPSAPLVPALRPRTCAAPAHRHRARPKRPPTSRPATAPLATPVLPQCPHRPPPRCTLGMSWQRPLRPPTYTVTGTAVRPPLPTKGRLPQPDRVSVGHDERPPRPPNPCILSSNARPDQVRSAP